MKNRITKHFSKIYDTKSRVEAAKNVVGYASALSRILAEDFRATGKRTKMPKKVMSMADEAYDVLMFENVPSSEWGV